MNWFEKIVDEALNDPYLDELLVKAEILCANEFLALSGVANHFSEQDFIDLIKFADILCRGDTAISKNKAYKIISLLHDIYNDDPYYSTCANTVFTKLGIFPAMDLIDSQLVFADMGIVLEKIMKSVYQESPLEEKVFTDAQYRLFEKLKNSNHYSFSGPTSFGKSFVIESFIQHIIKQSNGMDNIAVLVPTRALINQISSKLKINVKSTDYKVLTHPVVPNIFNQTGQKFIFVFTPERWVAYLSNKENPIVTYMFIDEAHKIIAPKDIRAALYYHAILLAERKSINLYFASPNIPNAEVFLQLFEKSYDENMVIQDLSVTQNRYFVDLLERNFILFSDTGKELNLPFFAQNQSVNQNKLLSKLGARHKNIVYCNTVSDTIEFSLDFSETLPVKANANLKDLISLIKKSVHNDYYLIDCLKHGVAFHFSKLPHQIRGQVESLFVNGDLDYIFCTSTLLEGVNLPAKNIFILNNAIGLSKFSHIDFWNLAGRAGRLSKEMSGNIICVRAIKKRNRWDVPNKDLSVVKNKQIAPVEPLIIKGQGNFYKNLGNAILNKNFTKKNCTENEKTTWKHYSNVLYTHQVSKTDSKLVNSFLKKNADSTKILDNITKTNNVPSHILEQSVTISPKYQNEIWNNYNFSHSPADFSSKSCEEILEILYEQYNWSEEESGGNNSLVVNKTRLKYFAVLMSSWISGFPLNIIIKNTIDYYTSRGSIYINREEVPFDKNSKVHINEIINNLTGDIDTGLRFKIRNYLLNFALICYEKTKDDVFILWVNYLEYGTTNNSVIALQTVGLPRHLANFIIEYHSDCMTFSGEQLIAFDQDKLLNELNASEFPQEFKELSEFFK